MAMRCKTFKLLSSAAASETFIGNMPIYSRINSKQQKIYGKYIKVWHGTEIHLHAHPLFVNHDNQYFITSLNNDIIHI